MRRRTLTLKQPTNITPLFGYSHLSLQPLHSLKMVWEGSVTENGCVQKPGSGKGADLFGGQCLGLPGMCVSACLLPITPIALPQRLRRKSSISAASPTTPG